MKHHITLSEGLDNFITVDMLAYDYTIKTRAEYTRDLQDLVWPEAYSPIHPISVEDIL